MIVMNKQPVTTTMEALIASATKDLRAMAIHAKVAAERVLNAILWEK